MKLEISVKEITQLVGKVDDFLTSAASGLAESLAANASGWKMVIRGIKDGVGELTPEPTEDKNVESPSKDAEGEPVVPHITIRSAAPCPDEKVPSQ